MQIERVQPAALTAGDIVAVSELAGWWLVTAATEAGSRIALRLSSLESGDHMDLEIERDVFVRRGESGAVHGADEFIGMTICEARVWAYALGWTFRDFSGPGEVVFTDDVSFNRINVAAAGGGPVTWAKLF